MKKLLVVLLVLGLATPAMAASQWYWYGTSRVFLGYVDNSKEFGTNSSYQDGIPSLDTSIRSDTINGYGDSGTVLNLMDSTRIGAKIVASDAVSAGMELSAWQTPISTAQTDNDQITAKYLFVRFLWGQWKFGNGSLRIGQDYTPAMFPLMSNEIGDLGWGGDEVMVTHSTPYISRRPQLKLTFGGFQFALIEHNTTTNLYRGFTGTDDEDFTLPRMEAAYQWNISPMISLRPVLGYQSYDAVRHTTTSETSESITSYVYGLGCYLRFGAAYVNLGVSGATNPGNYGLYQPNSSYTKAAYWGSGSVEDATSLGGIAVVGFTVSPMVKLEAGCGYLKTEGKGYGGNKSEQTSMNYYIQAPITVAPGVIITPEIGTLDMGDLDFENAAIDDQKQGTSTWFAVEFRVDF